MAQIDIPIPTATARVNAVVQDYEGNPPPNVINENDDWRVAIRLDSSGFLFDIATFTWKFVLRAEGNGAVAPELTLGPVMINHSGSPGGSPYSDVVHLPVTAGQLPVPAGQDSASYEHTLEVFAAVTLDEALRVEIA